VNKHMHKVVNIRNMKIFNVVALLYKWPKLEVTNARKLLPRGQNFG
jgi:hypothetical protein